MGAYVPAAVGTVLPYAQCVGASHEQMFLSLVTVGKNGVWRPTKKAGEEHHPRRELMVTGDKVFRTFLEWAPYLALKAELLEEDSTFKGTRRKIFLSTRYGCLGG